MSDRRDLCTLDDVVARIPGYTAGEDDDIDALLADLITQESRDFVETCGREIISIDSDEPVTRTFDLDSSTIMRGKLPIGDAAAIATVELFDYDGSTSLGVIDPTLYVLLPRIRDDWEPYRRLWFPPRPLQTPLLLAPGRTLALTGAYGFPAVPTTVTRAVATLVVFRYLNDVAPAGTDLADAADRAEFNLAASLKVALDTRDRLRGAPFA